MRWHSVVLLLLAACAPSTNRIELTAVSLMTDTPPTPEFIVQSENLPMTCVEIQPASIISTNESLAILQAQFDKTLKLAVDSQFIGSDLIDVTYGEVLEPVRVCITAEIEPGVHIANLQVGATSGRVYAYSWGFIVE